MSERERLYHRVTLLFSLTILGFGIAVVVRTLTAGGSVGSVGLLLGALFIALGVGRTFLAVRALR